MLSQFHSSTFFLIYLQYQFMIFFMIRSKHVDFDADPLTKNGIIARLEAQFDRSTLFQWNAQPASNCQGPTRTSVFNQMSTVELLWVTLLLLYRLEHVGNFAEIWRDWDHLFSIDQTTVRRSRGRGRMPCSFSNGHLHPNRFVTDFTKPKDNMSTQPQPGNWTS